MRVYELAKQLGMESRLLIPELVRLGIEVTSHSNTLDDESAGRIMEALQGKDDHGGNLKSLKVKRGDSDKVVAHTKRGELRGSANRQGVKGGRASSAVITEEPKKSEKKHILIKRKKDVEEETTPEAPMSERKATLSGGLQELSPLQEATTTPFELPSPSPPSPIPPPTPDLSHPSTLSERKDGEGDIAAGSPEPSPVPKYPEVAQVGLAPEPEEGRRGGKTEKKEAVFNETTDLIGEKVKKPKKGLRARDEDLFAARYEDAARWQDLRPLPTLRREERARPTQPTSVTEITKPRKKVIKLDPGISVKEFAEILGQRPAEVIRKLMEVGIALTLNQPMNLDAGMLIAEGMGVNVEVSSEKEGEALLEEVLEIKGEEQLIPRAPVVTIMGHVDHGKTTLLDAIRETRVTDQEAGGITQHIGAYSVKVGDKRVTFLDTPGHEAFTAMRARGAQVTDIVVLVVSADDGVMPQTVEALHHAQAAHVPIIVAINKMDKPGANPDRVKQGLSEHNLISEAWGGQTIFVEVSAKEKRGLDHLLEMILLQAEVMELKGDIEGSARAVVLEAKLDRGRGPVATVLVQAGLLKVGAVFVVGSVSGRIRALNSDTGAKLKEAGPSLPVEVIGLLGVPIAGDQFVVVKDDRMAREVADARHQKQRTTDLAAAGARRTLDELYAEAREGERKELSVLIKADVQGSVGALCDSVGKISSSAVNLRMIHSGVGGINESDVLLAAASEALIIGFHVRPEPKASALAEREGVEIRLHTVIYNAIADVRAAAEGLLEPTLKERVLGRAEVRELFSVPKVGTIAGCYVSDGSITRSSAGVRILRDLVTVYEGKVGSLRRFKDDVKEVQQGYECGIGVENYNDIKIGDVIEAFVYDEEPAKL